MISNLDPIGGAPLTPEPSQPPGEPFHPRCRIVSGEAIQRRVSQLLKAGEAQAALDLAEKVSKAVPGLFVISHAPE